MPSGTSHQIKSEAQLIDELRVSGLAHIGIGAIRLYQETLSRITPPQCRFSPSCSQYGITAIEEWGLWEGIKLTRERIAKCHKPNGGFDPVPRKEVWLSRETRVGEDEPFISIPNTPQGVVIEDYEHRFKLILSYPISREFLSREDAIRKIADFNRSVLQIPQYTILFKVNEVEIGTIEDAYLLRFTGTTSGEYLETSVDEVIQLLTAQLEGFFLVASKNEFQPLYFEVDGQAIIEPKPKQPLVPSRYHGTLNFWDYTSNADIWDDYWGYFLVESLIDLLASVIPEVVDIPNVVTPDVDGCDLNPLDGDGCDLGDGCDVEGCDGCDVGGCDGCDVSDGCDLVGCW